MTPASTSEHYRAQQRLAVATVTAARRAWASMSPDFDASWVSVGPQLLSLATAAQLGSARQGVAYLPKVLGETDQPDRPEGRLVPEALVGVAADGRPLDTLLYGAVTQSKTAMTGAADPVAALAQGSRWLDMALASIVSDAARDAVGVGIAARPRVGGYVRMLNTPSCSRCAILAGKWFRWNEGFLRHPRCDCRHIPSSEDRAGDFRTDPRLAVERGQVRGLTKAETEAIGEGADVSQVVNSRRGMTTTLGRKTTTEGTTVRGAFGRSVRDRGTVKDGGRYSRASTVRLRPEAIYAEAKGDRAEAIRLLKRFGYLT